ncbi:MAG: hypothetical protein R2715_01740 [Ilumatobacteraceae bacterium]
MAYALDAAGALDQSFGDHGLVHLAAPLGALVTSTPDTADGLFVAGLDPSGQTLRVAHLLADGSFDAAFGSAGFLEVEVDARAPSGMWLLGSDLVVGLDATAGQDQFVRLSSAGALRTSWGTGGVATGNAPGAHTVWARNDGGIVVLGTNLVLLGFDATGTAQPSYAAVPSSGIDRFLAAAPTPDGGFVALTYAYYNTWSRSCGDSTPPEPS